MASLSHNFLSQSTSSPPPQGITFSTSTTSSPLPVDSSEPPSLLVSILPHRLQFLSIQKPAVPSLCYALLRLLLEAQDRNSFLSYTETDDKDVSLLLDASLLAEFKASLAHLPNLSIAPPTATAAAAAAIQLIGYPLRAIQVLEGYSGHVDTAIIATVSTALADAGFSIFYVSTNHADYVLVREEELAAVLGCLADRFVLIKDEMEGDEEDDDDGQRAAHEHADERKEAEADSGAAVVREREVVKASSAPTLSSLLSPDSAHSDWSDEVRKSPRRERERRRHDNGSERSEDEERMIREALRRSKRNRHKRTEEREGIAEEEESEQEEWSQASRTPPSAFLGSTPLDPSPAMALSSLSLAASSSFSSGAALSSASFSARPLRLQAMPYSLILHSFVHSDMPSYFSALLQLIFFPPRPVTSSPSSSSTTSPTSSASSSSSPHLSARFFSFTMIDHDYSLITTPPSTLSASFPPTLLASLHSSQQWSVIEALGVFRYDESGLVSRVSRPLSGAGLRFFYFSSWRTGFVIVHSEDERRALEALRTQFQVVA